MSTPHSIQKTSARWGLVSLFALSFSLPACGSNNTDESNTDDIEIAGSWESNFGGLETITSDAWANEWLTTTVIEYSNDNNWAINQNPDDDEFNPSQFSKVVWTEPTVDAFYYCTVAFGLDTADDARSATETADNSDPDNSGCGGFGWTKLSRPQPTDPASSDSE